MKEALFYKKLKGGAVQCILCPNNCLLKQGEYGKCFARKNIGGRLIATTYGKPCSVAVEPIEKKPLFHFLPGCRTFSIATAGCNLKCLYCQNYVISQAKVEDVPYREISPKQAVDEALADGCRCIAYTYTEPTVFYEYVLDTAMLAKKKGIRNICITNGYINLKPLHDLYKYIDAVNIDLKGFNEGFYKDICGARLKPVLNAIREIKKMGVWIEITNLIVPGLNDDTKEIKEMCRWIAQELGKDVPLHFSRFFAQYKMRNKAMTPEGTLMKAYKVAKDEALNYVYVGNVQREENTYCPRCNALLVQRIHYFAIKNNIKNGKCGCGKMIAGVWG